MNAVFVMDLVLLILGVIVILIHGVVMVYVVEKVILTNVVFVWVKELKKDIAHVVDLYLMNVENVEVQVLLNHTAIAIYIIEIVQVSVVVI